MLLKYFALLASLEILAPCVAASDVFLPKPQGPYGTVLTTAKLIDYGRVDPFAPSNQTRALMISIFYPVETSQCSRLTPVNYMPPATAAVYDTMYGSLGIPSGTFASFKLQICSKPLGAYRQIRQHPVLLFSPGLGNSRHQYNAIAQSAASNGYVVVSVDHPYDASVVEFPDGSTIAAANIDTDAQIELSLATRAKDISFVLNQLSSPAVMKTLLPAVPCGLNTKTVGIFGHSLGGATAISAMVNDTRLVGGANLDGSFFGPAIQQGTKRPFLIVSHQDKNQTTDPSWAAMWPNLRRWKLELEVKGTQHVSFTDFPVLVDALGLPAQARAALAGLMGTIAGSRDAEIIRVYVGAFFEFVLRGKNSQLLAGPSNTYPEVVFVDK